MVQWKKETNDLLIRYGYDDIAGFFISVYDKYLEKIKDEDITNLFQDIFMVKDGGSCYLSISTRNSINKEVTKSILVNILKCYNIDKRFINLVRYQVDCCENGECNKKIDERDIKKCSKCEYKVYCSKECQKMGWVYHKRECINQNTSTYELFEMVKKDYFCYMTYRIFTDYKFINYNLDDQVQLFGVYIGLINILECNLNELHKAMESNTLREFIIDEFKRKTTYGNHTAKFDSGKYILWFEKNFRNTNSLKNKLFYMEDNVGMFNIN